MKIFLTGRPGSGKSTVLMKIVEFLKQKGLKVGGIVTPEIRVKGKRVGFSVKDIYSGEEGILASVCQKTGPKISKYRVNVDDFERVALKALDFSLRECDVIVIDEIGKAEFFSSKFRQKINEILKSDKITIAILHRNFIDKFKEYGKVVEVTLENRNKLAEEIIKSLSLGK